MVLLVVDAQEGIVAEELYEKQRFIKQVKALIETARKQQIEVIFVRHDDGEELTKGQDGFDIYHGFYPKTGEKIFDKTVNSAFRDTGLLSYLRDKKETEVIIVGLQTDYCIDATVKCGFEHGFTMIVPAYCNTTVSNEYMTAEQTYRYYNEKMWQKRYVTGISFDRAVDMIMTVK